MKKDYTSREKEIINFCTDLSVIWRKYAIDKEFQSFIDLFEWHLLNVPNCCLSDVEYIERIREFYENKTKGE